MEVDSFAAITGLAKLSYAPLLGRLVASLFAAALTAVGALAFYYAAPWRWTDKAEANASTSKTAAPEADLPAQPAAQITVVANSGAVVVVGTARDISVGGELVGQYVAGSYQVDGVELARPHTYVLWPGGSWSNRTPYTAINREGLVKQFLATKDFRESAGNAQALVCLGLASNRWSKPEFAGHQRITDTRAEHLCALVLQNLDSPNPQSIMGIGLGYHTTPPQSDAQEERQRSLVFLLIERGDRALSEEQLRSVVLDVLTTQGAIFVRAAAVPFDPTAYSRSDSIAEHSIVQINRNARLK